MLNCQRCGNEWNWTTTYKKMFTFKTKMECPYCHEPQYMSKETRQCIGIISTLIPFVIFLPLITFGVPVANIILIELITFIIVMAYLPSFYKLSNEDEPLW
ncbi:TIGR04104 family putative zinc finger protein [Cytobacillus purgationiresistens]|uniref:CXXC-20-CXXC protein n=1 Tax=Cytobacillus purgationiresistens TaxID=863449 RepID=A0ABU0AMJ6_9BACI|nr:TIGR04104 family putative zinc finger protein [Cytobacillus purgationiresistens]MDQ0272483.1 CXXC-20-CXXC protein [Cytobacillus purgationiresistens]